MIGICANRIDDGRILSSGTIFLHSFSDMMYAAIFKDDELRLCTRLENLSVLSIERMTLKLETDENGTHFISAICPFEFAQFLEAVNYCNSICSLTFSLNTTVRDVFIDGAYSKCGNKVSMFGDLGSYLNNCATNLVTTIEGKKYIANAPLAEGGDTVKLNFSDMVCIYCETKNMGMDSFNLRFHPYVPIDHRLRVIYICNQCHTNYMNYRKQAIELSLLVLPGEYNEEVCACCADSPSKLVLCAKCPRSFCGPCLQRLLTPKDHAAMKTEDNWLCMCCVRSESQFRSIVSLLHLSWPLLGPLSSMEASLAKWGPTCDTITGEDELDANDHSAATTTNSTVKESYDVSIDRIEDENVDCDSDCAGEVVTRTKQMGGGTGISGKGQPSETPGKRRGRPPKNTASADQSIIPADDGMRDKQKNRTKEKKSVHSRKLDLTEATTDSEDEVGGIVEAKISTRKRKVQARMMPVVDVCENRDDDRYANAIGNLMNSGKDGDTNGRRSSGRQRPISMKVLDFIDTDTYIDTLAKSKRGRYARNITESSLSTASERVRSSDPKPSKQTTQSHAHGTKRDKRVSTAASKAARHKDKDQVLVEENVLGVSTHQSLAIPAPSGSAADLPPVDTTHDEVYYFSQYVEYLVSIKDTPASELDTEDLCFLCKDGGELVECDHQRHKGVQHHCKKVYHEYCLCFEVAEESIWRCFRHFCGVCGSEHSSVLKCKLCPNSFCNDCIPVWSRNNGHQSYIICQGTLSTCDPPKLSTSAKKGHNRKKSNPVIDIICGSCIRMIKRCRERGVWDESVVLGPMVALSSQEDGRKDGVHDDSRGVWTSSSSQSVVNTSTVPVAGVSSAVASEVLVGNRHTCLYHCRGNILYSFCIQCIQQLLLAATGVLTVIPFLKA